MSLPRSAHITMVTLGVADLAASKAFYMALGWQDTAASNETVVFLQGGTLILGLYGRGPLAEDAQVADTPTGFAAVTLAANQPDRESVDAFFTRALLAGAKAIKHPQEVFWGGYSGYFADPDGHLWEIAHNPFMPLDDNGRGLLEPAAETTL